MIIRISRILLLLQKIGTTVLGTFMYDLVATITGFVMGVLITDHFKTSLGMRDLNAQNDKLQKGIQVEFKQASFRTKKIRV